VALGPRAGKSPESQPALPERSVATKHHNTTRNLGYAHREGASTVDAAFHAEKTFPLSLNLGLVRIPGTLLIVRGGVERVGVLRAAPAVARQQRQARTPEVI
jgi:hypothetical protein